MVSTNTRRALLCTGLALCGLATAVVWRALGVTPAEPLEPPRLVTPHVSTDPAHSASPGTTLDPGAPLAHTPELAPSAVNTLVIQGRARTHAGASAANAGLVLARSDGASERTLGRTTSTSDGRFRFELSADDAQGDAGADLVLRASAPGFQPACERRPLAEVWARAGSTRDYEWTLVLLPGQVLRGRTVDAALRPVAGAEVRLLAPSLRGARPVTSVVARTTSGADGRFELGYASSGAYQLAARAEDAGTALLTELALPATHDMELGDVPLAGAGSIRGRVVRARGTAVAGLELWALPADGRTRPATTLAAAQALAERETGDGLAWSRARTSVDGAFTFTGLRPGSYVLVAQRAGLRFDPPPAPCKTPADGLVLRVASAAITVTVRDEHGAPAPGAQVSCARLALSGDGEVQLSARGSALSDAAGRAAFDVDAEHAYVLRAELGARVAEERVELSPGADEVARELVLPSADGPAQLRLAVRGSLGESVHEYRVSLLSALTDERLAAFADLAPDEAGAIGPLPPGRYHVEVVPFARDGAPPVWLAARPRDEVVLRAGATTALEVTLVTGTALGLELVIEGPPPADFAFKTERELDARALAAALRAHALTRGASVRLEPIDPAGVPRALAFEVPADNPAAPPALANTLLPGSSANVHGRCPPGVYRLVVDAPGFAPYAETVALAAGETRTLRAGLRAP